MHFYFGTKDALVRAVLEYQAEQSERELAEAFARAPGRDGIRAWLDGVVAGQRHAGFVGGCPWPRW